MSNTPGGEELTDAFVRLPERGLLVVKAAQAVCRKLTTPDGSRRAWASPLGGAARNNNNNNTLCVFEDFFTLCVFRMFLG